MTTRTHVRLRSHTPWPGLLRLAGLAVGLLSLGGVGASIQAGRAHGAAQAGSTTQARSVVLQTGAAVTCIPTSAHAPGSAGTSWRTDLEVHNPGGTQASYTIALLKHGTDNSSPATRSFSLAPGRSVRYPDVVLDRFAFTGKAALRITVTAGSVMVTSRTYNDLGAAGAFGQLVPALADGQAIAFGEDGRLIQLSHQPVATAGGFRTNLGVVNATGSTVVVSIALYRADRTSLGTVPLTLRPYDYQQVDKIFERVTTTAVADGFAIVRTSTPGGRFFAFASVIDNRTSDPICIPAARVVGGAVPPTPTPTPTPPAGKPNLVVYKPQTWPNCVVCNSREVDPPAWELLWAGTTTYVYWSVANLGTATLTGPVSFGIYLDGTRNLTLGWDNPQGLQAGRYVSFVPAQITVPEDGVHAVEVRADPDNAVAESNEADNGCSFTGRWYGIVLAPRDASRASGDEGTVSAAAAGTGPVDGWQAVPSPSAATAQVFWVGTSAHIGGSGGTNWRTDVELHNPGAGQLACAVELLKHATDNSAAATSSVTLSAGQAVRLGDIVSQRFSFTGKAALRLTSTGPAVITSRTYNDQPGGSYGQLVPAWPDAEAIGAGEQGRIIQLSHQPNPALGGSRANLGIVNATSSPLDVTVELFKADGTRLGQVPVSLRPLDYQQLDKVFERVTSSPVQDGYAVLRTTTTSGRFFAYASVIDNLTSDPVYVPAQKVPSLFTYGPPRVVTVNSGASTEVTDSTIGVTVVFPKGGHGTLSTAAITGAPYEPWPGGSGFHVEFTGTERFQVKLAATAGVDTLTYAWGPSRGCWDGVARTERWNPWPESATQAGFLVYDTPDNSTGAASALDLRTAVAQMQYNDYWVNKINPSSTDGQRQQLLAAQVREDIEGWLAKLSDPLRSAARAQLIKSFPIRIYASSEASYSGFARRWVVGTTISPRIVFDLAHTPATTVAHETGHLMNHLLARAVLGEAAGDARYLQIEDLAPSLHGLGDPQTAPQTTTEEAAFLSQLLVIGDVDQIDAYDMRTVVPAYLKGTPKAADFRTLEGFGMLLVANLMRPTATMYDWERKSATVPVIGATWHDVAGIVGRGATTIMEYRDNIQAFLEARGQGDRFGALAERIGWSYHAKGKVLAEGSKAPVAGVTVKNLVKLDGVEHLASQATTGSDGAYTLPRLFPGCSTLRVTKDPHSVDYSTCNRWDLPTTQEVALSDSYITVDPPVGNPTVSVSPPSGTTVKVDKTLSFDVTAVPVAGTTITRIDLWKGSFFLRRCENTQTCGAIATSSTGGMGPVTFTARVLDSRGGPEFRFDFIYTWVL